MSWSEAADRAIAAVVASLPADTPYEELKRAISKAYPWGERKYWPYKAWLARVRSWLIAIREAERAGLPRPKTINAAVHADRPKKVDRETRGLFD